MTDEHVTIEEALATWNPTKLEKTYWLSCGVIVWHQDDHPIAAS